jgi:Mrp family chromosome partitioning ATPase
LGVGSAVERFDRSYRTREQIERDLPAACLGIVPRFRSFGWGMRIMQRLRKTLPGEKSGPASNRLPASFFVGVGQVLRRLRLPTETRTGEVFMVTGSTPGEGASTLTFGLAHLARKTATTLIIDGDFTKPSISERHGRAIGRLVSALGGEVEIGKAVAVDEDRGVYRLTPAGRQAFAHALAELDDRRVAAMIAELRCSFALVLIDGPPILSGSRCARLVELCDRAIVVVEWRSTPREVVMAALHSLGTGIKNVGGFVLNKVDPREYRLYPAA